MASQPSNTAFSPFIQKASFVLAVIVTAALTPEFPQGNFAVSFLLSLFFVGSLWGSFALALVSFERWNVRRQRRNFKERYGR